MSCYHPIEAWDYTDQLDLLGPRQISMKGPQDFRDREKMIRQGRRLLLPCRKCVGCRLDKSREWANRVVMDRRIITGTDSPRPRFSRFVPSFAVIAHPSVVISQVKTILW